jgi:hypothetical protein
MPLTMRGPADERGHMAALTAYAISVYTHRVFDRPTGHLAAAAAAAHLALLLSFIVDSGFFSLEGAVITVVPALLWIWIAYTGSTLTTRRLSAA